nr:MAG TPA: hypothetical protein [Caudoviricetes sp.]
MQLDGHLRTSTDKLKKGVNNPLLIFTITCKFTQ